MSLVHELQRSVEKDDLLNVLRRARRVASNLGVADINHWLQCELEGYDNGISVPRYRTISCQLIYTTGPLPADCDTGMLDYPGMPSQDRLLRQSIREILAMIDEIGAGQPSFRPPLNREELINALNSSPTAQLTTQVSFMVRANVVQIRAIPEAVKDRIYDWAVALENRGVLGENMTFFTDSEKAIAHTINFALTNCQVEQLNNMGQNLRRNNV